MSADPIQNPRARPRWRGAWIDRTGQDLRYAVRLLRRRPVLSATAVLTLALGMGGTTAVFSLLDALLARALPVDRPEELLRLVERRADGSAADDFTVATYDTLAEHATLLSRVAASTSGSPGRLGEIVLNGERRRAIVQLVSDDYFDVLGVRAVRGRVFHPPQPGVPREPIAVISEEYWRRELGGDPAVLGMRFRQADRELTIAGIAPPGFRGAELDVPVDIWFSIEHVVTPGDEERFRVRWVRVLARLGPGVSVAQAQAQCAALLDRPVELRPGGRGYSDLRQRFRQPLLLVAVVVGLVLLIACGNLANLTLAATLSREREIAVRGAVGASRGRIVRQLVTESLLLSVLGAALGLGLARWGSAALLAFLPPDQALALPNLSFQLDARLLAFVGCLTLLTCLLFGVAPALRATGTMAAAALKSGPGTGERHRSGLSRGLIVGQVVLCTALLIVAGVFLRTLQNLRGQDAGYREERLLVADTWFPREYGEEIRDRLVEELRARAEALPGVEVASFSHIGQLSGWAHERRIGFPGRASPGGEAPTAIVQRISPGFVEAMGTPLVAGRDFLASDDADAPLVALVNETFARRFSLGQDPLGVRFFQEGGSRSRELIEIVGVVRDSKWVHLREESPPMWYLPYRQLGGYPQPRLALRTTVAPELVAPALRDLARDVDEQMALTNLVPFREIVDRTLVIERLVAQVSAAFGGLALLIAAVGLYGVLAYGVARRRREIGLRIAVGALPGAIERMFLAEALGSVALGVLLGIPTAIAVTHLAAAMLFGLSPQDPTSVGGAVAALTVTTAVAAYLAARGASRTDPLRVLREE